MKNSEEQFIMDKEKYYSLHAPAWGGYLATKNKKMPDINAIPYEKRDINLWETQYIDYEYSDWLNEHPEFNATEDTKTELTDEYLHERMDIVMKYYNSDIQVEKQWASNMLLPEICGYIKSQLTRFHIIDPGQYENMLHEGYWEVLKNIQKYNNEYKLTTFAKWHVTHAYSRAFSEYVNNIGYKYAYEVSVLKKVLRKFEEELNIPNPTLSELASACGVGWTTQDVETILAVMENVQMAMLDEALEVPDTYENTQKAVEHKLIEEDLYNAIDKLSSEKKEIFLLSYGLHPDYRDQSLSLTRVAEIVGLSFNKTRKLLEKAKKEVVHDKKLRSYFENDTYIESKVPDKITKNKESEKFIAKIFDEDDVIEGKMIDDNSDIDDNGIDELINNNTNNNN